MRYLIASLPDQSTDTLIRHIYRQAFAKACPVRTLHLTIIPPFLTDHLNISPIQESLASISTFPSALTATAPQIFNRHRQILHFPLEPKEILGQIYQTLFTQIKPLITFETTDFAANEIPEFLPHITLDYNFTANLSLLTPPESPLIFTPPKLLTETAPGIWQSPTAS
jgi:2'-5' RNA ligase